MFYFVMLAYAQAKFFVGSGTAADLKVEGDSGEPFCTAVRYPSKPLSVHIAEGRLMGAVGCAAHTPGGTWHSSRAGKKV